LVDSKIIAITGILPFSALTISYLAEKRAGYILAARGREGKQRKRRVLIIGDSTRVGRFGHGHGLGLGHDDRAL
jgi:hypothetical protein